MRSCCRWNAIELSGVQQAPKGNSEQWQQPARALVVQITQLDKHELHVFELIRRQIISSWTKSALNGILIAERNVLDPLSDPTYIVSWLSRTCSEEKNLRRHETGERISFMNIVKARRDQMPRCSICFVLCLELSFPSLCGLQRTQPPEPNSIMLIFDYKNMNNELRSFAGDIELIFLFRARADQAQIEKGISVVELPSWASICHDIGSGRRFDFTFAT